ncbi:hypothetical protein [Leptolyngbya sp. FACHB-261]|uniref:hypothetical protein n=1 Tax=Leptolyngbya sp. FACHB-261 TaxID=2692806 RepID=UPI00168A108E|nr:hypothetical protein [Leptolyngbya sp. FACHB-261]MBD2103222.1 hypothetical protein [Leptolyngbya sp. FACHB-261]
MLGQETTSIRFSAAQTSNYVICETELTNQMIDCYPYAIRGSLTALALGIGF